MRGSGRRVPVTLVCMPLGTGSPPPQTAVTRAASSHGPSPLTAQHGPEAHLAQPSGLHPALSGPTGVRAAWNDLSSLQDARLALQK